jgi:hypothetical protein
MIEEKAAKSRKMLSLEQNNGKLRYASAPSSVRFEVDSSYACFGQMAGYRPGKMG